MNEQTRTPIFIDTDMGCDDAMAIAWLLGCAEAEVIGFSTVFGNSSVQNTSANLLTLLDAMGYTLPVTLGAATPLVYPRTSAGALLHGPDGFWGAQTAYDVSELPRDAPGAIAAVARATPGLTVLALGPLTNIARAVQAYPTDMATVRLVALGGARAVGTITPVAEFNSFADPHALAILLESGVRLELVTCDATQQVRVDSTRLGARLDRAGSPTGALLARLLRDYGRAHVRDVGNGVSVPDAVAALYAMWPALGSALPAAVRVVTEGQLTRGQTIVATTLNHQIALAFGAAGVERLADQSGLPNFDMHAAVDEALARAPQNALVVLRVDAPAIVQRLEAGLLDVVLEGRDRSRRYIYEAARTAGA